MPVLYFKSLYVREGLKLSSVVRTNTKQMNNVQRLIVHSRPKLLPPVKEAREGKNSMRFSPQRGRKREGRTPWYLVPS